MAGIQKPPTTAAKRDKNRNKKEKEKLNPSISIIHP
jgi:hypothetical protein